MRTKIIIVFGFIFLISSCDPAKILFVKNKTGKKVEVEFEISDCNDKWVKVLKEKEDFKKITLGTDKKEKISYYLFGLGVWSKGELEALNECVQSITIKEMDHPIRKIEGEELKKYLPQKRKGLLNQKMKISIINGR